MNEMKMLIDIIEKNIIKIRNIVDSNQKFDGKLCNSLKNNIRTIVNDNNLLISLDIKKIKEMCSEFEESDYQILEFYKNILSTSNFQMSEYDQGKLRKILAKINTLLLDYENKYKNLYRKEKQEIKEYENLLGKLKNEVDLNANEMETIYIILANSDINVNDAIKIMRYIANTMISKYDILENIEDEEIEEELEETNLNVEDLVELFKKYNSNFDLLSKSIQQELQKYGNLNNIEQIFNIFEKYNITSINQYIEKREGALCGVFIYSNATLVEQVFATCIKYGIASENNAIIDFSLLLKQPSKFIKRKKKLGKRGIDFGGSDDSEKRIGSQEDFIKNVEFFVNEGLNIREAYEKSSTYFDLPHEHIQIGVKNLKLYGIDSDLYLKTLSCFKTIKQADAFDQFIELGYFDYVKNNLSRLCFLSDDPTFFKIARANQLGIKIPRNRNGGMPSNVTYASKEYLGINQTNGATQTRRYIPNFLKSGYFDEAVYLSDNSNIILVKDEDLIKELDNRYLIEGENEQVYLIAGVRISRLKVLRFYNTLKMSSLSGTLDSLLYVITKNSIITNEQYNDILREISRFYYNRQQNSRMGTR